VRSSEGIFDDCDESSDSGLCNCKRKLRLLILEILGIFLYNRRISVDGCKKDFVFFVVESNICMKYILDVVIYSNVQYTEAGLETAFTKMLLVC
jgi:hypothetical protein